MKPIIIANWKMNLNRESGLTLIRKVLSNLSNKRTIRIIFAPPFTY